MQRFVLGLPGFLLALGLLVSGPWGTVLAADLPVPSPPPADAASYVLMNFRSGQILAEQNPDQHRKPASTTKLMTAYVVFQALAAGRITPATQFTVSQNAWKQIGSRMFLKPGSQVSVDDLLQGLLIPSGNDAAMTLAEGVGGTAAGFVNIMNADARKLGLSNTHYANPTGLPADDLYTSARDLAILSRAIIRQFPQYRHYFTQKEFTWNGIHQTNWNKLLWLDSSVDGLKTGYTENAGYCLAATAKRNDQRMIAVVMGVPMVSKTDTMANYHHLAQVADSLLNYGLQFYETHKLYDAGHSLTTARVWKGADKYVQVGLAQPFYVTNAVGHFKELRIATDVATRVDAPVKSGTSLGQITVTDQGKTLTSAPLVALKAVPAGGLWPELRDTVLGLF